MSKGSSQTVTNVQQLPPALESALETAYTDFNPFQRAFDAVGNFNPLAPLQGVSGLTGTEQAAIDAGAGLLSNRPAFLDSAATGLNDMISGGGTNNLLQTQIDDATSRAVDSVSSQYARGGRLGSDSFADSLGRGITNAAAPILAQNLQRDQANRLAAISAAPGLLSADQSIINQALALGGLERGIAQAQQDAAFNQLANQNTLDQNQINALLSAAGMGSGLFGRTSTESGGGPSAIQSGLGGALTGAGIGSQIGAVGGPLGAAIGGGLGLLGLI